MFKVAGHGQSYPCTITVGMIDDNGVKKDHKFTIRFRRVAQDELESIHDRLNVGKQKTDGETPPGETLEKLTDNQLLHEVVVGFGSDVLGEDDKPLEFNADNLNLLANTFPCRPAMVQAFFDSCQKVLRKN